jgi:triosephosphate isomerase
MAKKYIIGANWKMNLSLQEATKLFHSLSDTILPDEQREVLVFVPQPFLGLFKSNECITVGAQNFHAPELFGAFTGETSLQHLKSLGVSTVLVGHSERRIHFGESNDTVMMKARKAVDEGFRVVLCCGEPLEVREKGEVEALNFVHEQLKLIENWPAVLLHNIIIAYEPIWAIGTGKTPTLDEIEYLQSNLHAKLFEATNVDFLLIYGGSCDSENSKEIFALNGVNGGLIGGASLIVDSLLQIIFNAC